MTASSLWKPRRVIKLRRLNPSKRSLISPAAVIRWSTAAGFNPSYLLDALGAFDTPYVNFAFTAPSKPCQLTGLATPDGNPLTDYRHVIMLMRLPQLSSCFGAIAPRLLVVTRDEA